MQPTQPPRTWLYRRTAVGHDDTSTDSGVGSGRCGQDAQTDRQRTGLLDAQAARSSASVASSGSSSHVRVGVYERATLTTVQLTRLRAYIDAQPDWRHVATFSDHADSPTNDRPGLDQTLAAAHAGAFDVLLVYRIDRLARRIDDLVDLLDQFERAGVGVHSATEPFDTAIPSDLALVRLFAAVARPAS